MTLFGTDGIRGRAGEPPLTEHTARRLGLAMRRQLGPSPLVVVRDTRESGGWLRDALVDGMRGPVVDAGVLPTPALSALLAARVGGGGVAITASHNPWHDNGLKVMGPGGVKLDDDAEGALEQDILRGEGEPLGPLSLEQLDGEGSYLEALRGALPEALDLSGRTIALDCAHGAASVTAPRLLRELGARVLTQGVQPDGRNINEGVGALHPDALARMVVERGAAVGIALDGDGDRCVLVDGRGRIVDGDALLLLLARPPGLVGTVMCNAALERQLAGQGIGFTRTPVGDRSVAAEMRRSGWTVGGEPSGHVLLSDGLPTGDGLLTALRVLAGGIDLAARLADWSPDPQDQRAVTVEHKPPLHELEALQRAQEQAREEGVSRVLLRYSGTEPKLRVLVEAPEAELAERWGSRLAEIAAEVLQ